MIRKVDIEQRALILDDLFKVEEALVSFEKFDGTMSAPVRRLDLVRGDAVAAILFNRVRRRAVLIRQFRYATLSRGEGWITETVAGLIDEGETPEQAVRRETLEEAGYEIEPPRLIACYYPTPGVTSERLFLYYAETRGEAPIAKGGGLAEEHEDIEVVELPLDEAFAELDRGAFADGKTIIGLMWLRRHLSEKR